MGQQEEPLGAIQGGLFAETLKQSLGSRKRPVASRIKRKNDTHCPHLKEDWRVLTLATDDDNP